MTWTIYDNSLLNTVMNDSCFRVLLHFQHSVSSEDLNHSMPLCPIYIWDGMALIVCISHLAYWNPVPVILFPAYCPMSESCCVLRIHIKTPAVLGQVQSCTFSWIDKFREVFKYTLLSKLSRGFAKINVICIIFKWITYNYMWYLKQIDINMIIIIIINGFFNVSPLAYIWKKLRQDLLTYVHAFFYTYNILSCGWKM